MYVENGFILFKNPLRKKEKEFMRTDEECVIAMKRLSRYEEKKNRDEFMAVNSEHLIAFCAILGTKVILPEAEKFFKLCLALEILRYGICHFFKTPEAYMFDLKEPKNTLRIEKMNEKFMLHTEDKENVSLRKFLNDTLVFYTQVKVDDFTTQKLQVFLNGSEQELKQLKPKPKFIQKSVYERN